MKLRNLISAVMLVAMPAIASNVIPRPLTETVNPDGKRFSLTEKATIGYAPGLGPQAEYLANAVAGATGWELKGKEGSKGSIVLAIDTVAAPRAEGYQLSITPSGVKIKAHDAAGAFYGVQTLLQYFPPEILSPVKVGGVEWSAPCVEVADAPNYPWRGMMLDAARYYYEPEYVKRFIDMMAMYKLNKLQFHFIDDCGWRLESKKYPRLTEIGAWAGEGADRTGGYYSQDDIRDIIDYASVRGIEVIPEIEFPAHFLAAIVAYPWLGCTGVQHQVPKQHFISRDLICPGKETSMKFLRDILDETIDLFPGKYVNIGGDEASYSRWEECPDCQALLKREGLSKPSELQGWLTNQVAQWMKEKGRTVIGWEEIIMRGDVSTPVVGLVWHNPADSTVVKPGGHKAILTPASHLYFDFPESSIPGEPQHAGWMPPISVEKAYSMPLNDHSADGSVMGVQACIWSDQFIHGYKLQDIAPLNENRSMQYVEHFVMPRMLALAELGWTPQSGRDFGDFERRMAEQFPRLEAKGINYRVPVPVIESQLTNADGSVTIALCPNVAGATIRYTTDGTWPTRHSAVYEGPVTVTRPSDFLAINMVTPRHYSLPLMQRRDYKEYAEYGSFTDEWDPLSVQSRPSKMEIECTGKISGNGTFRITFVPEGQNGKLLTGNAKLLKRDEVIGSVERDFATGASYDFTVTDFEAGTPFFLVVEAYSPEASESHGVVFTKKLD